MRWINLYQLAVSGGFVYFEAYANGADKAIGWITKALGDSAYRVFYSDGKHEVVTTRGTFHHARYCIEGLARTYAASSGVPLDILKLAASEGWRIDRAPEHGNLVVITTRAHLGAAPVIVATGKTIYQAILHAEA